MGSLFMANNRIECMKGNHSMDNNSDTNNNSDKNKIPESHPYV